jgi:hypothetical protein
MQLLYRDKKTCGTIHKLFVKNYRMNALESRYTAPKLMSQLVSGGGRGGGRNFIFLQSKNQFALAVNSLGFY